MTPSTVKTAHKIRWGKLKTAVLVLFLLGSIGAASWIVYPTHLAARIGHFGLLKWLIENDPERVNAEDYDYATPLHMAALHGGPEIVAFLIEKGADVNAVEADTLCTPLHFASKSGNEEVVRLLISNGARTNIGRGGGWTPVHDTKTPVREFIETLCTNDQQLREAAQSGEADRVKDLLKTDPGIINASDESGSTALHYASEHGHLDVVEILLEHGADPALADIRSRTPTERASIRHKWQIRKMLRDLGKQ